MTGRPFDATEALEILVAEVERWNRQINLVSRVRTRERVAALVNQCRRGWDLASSVLAEEGGYADATYVDIGSGAGFPGLVWAAERRQLGHTGSCVLVEPRDKRAWFLRRTVRLMGLEGVSVQESRWGEAPLVVESRRLLVTLKALWLAEGEILAGLPAAETGEGEGRLLVLRFLDPAHHTRARIEDEFAAMSVSEPASSGSWRSGGAEVLGTGDPSLLLTRYHAG